MARTRAVFFDVGNTLLFPYPSVSEVCRQVLQRHGHVHDLGAIEDIMPLVDAYYEDRYRADDTFWTNEEETSGVWVGMYSLMLDRLGIDENAATIAREVYDEFGSAARWRAYDDVAPAFERLRERGFILGIISNWDTRLATLLSGLGLSEYLGPVVSSAAEGLHKPDPRVFELACDRVGVPPGECVHVGDHYYADVLGARAVGMTPVLISRRGECPPEGERPIVTLDELDALIP